MKEVNAPRGGESLKVVCAWCGGVIRAEAAKPSKGMCQTCFARMMSEYSRSHRPRAGLRDASDR
ncbi:MAG TPA: hypothetical protein VGB98_07620 [Pyrinomonadaceae bacterium]|jgi:hypothetical protein